ncbi:uncharacterized protein LOC102679455 isoform X4 [Apis dorsata]|uniref:uncharacterized protein LOC102679455 isoform X4 n=1 Tax=Apis dorsata TaxID=7462 RepID=UPI0012937FA4|nr:uncharacterized protein LOC102679455 isoform X4 [Apis dorsata]
MGMLLESKEANTCIDVHKNSLEDDTRVLCRRRDQHLGSRHTRRFHCSGCRLRFND